MVFWNHNVVLTATDCQGIKSTEWVPRPRLGFMGQGQGLWIRASVLQLGLFEALETEYRVWGLGFVLYFSWKNLDVCDEL